MNKMRGRDRAVERTLSHTHCQEADGALHGKGKETGSHRCTQTITQRPTPDSVEERLLLVMSCDDFNELAFSPPSDIPVNNLFTPGNTWLVQQSLTCAFSKTSLVNQTASRFCPPPIWLKNYFRWCHIFENIRGLKKLTDISVKCLQSCWFNRTIPSTHTCTPQSKHHLSEFYHYDQQPTRYQGVNNVECHMRSTGTVMSRGSLKRNARQTCISKDRWGYPVVTNFPQVLAV